MRSTSKSSLQTRYLQTLLCLLNALLLVSQLVACANGNTQSAKAPSLYDQHAQRTGIMARMDAQATGFNPYERSISPQNVAQLQETGKYKNHDLGLEITVTNGIIYTQFENVVSAIDENNGQTLWHYTLPAHTVIDGYPYAPVVANGHVYVAQDNILCALDARNGKRQWCYSPEKTETFSTELSYAANALYVATKQTLFALNAQTGKLAWSYSLEEPGSQILIANGRIYIGSQKQHGALIALDAHSGKMQWKFEHVQGDYGVLDANRPVESNGIIYIASLSTLYAVNALTGQEVWNVHLSGNVSAPIAPAIANNLLYYSVDAGNEKQQFQALDVKTGKIVWSHQLEGWQSACKPIVANGVIYACTNNTGTTDNYGKYWIYALNAQSGQELRQFVSASSTFTPFDLKVANGHLYIDALVSDFFNAGSALAIWSLP